MMKKIGTLLLLAVSLFFASCNDSDDTPTTATLTLNLSGLEALGASYVYEGWIIVNGSPVSTGTFTSVSFPQSFVVDATQLASATTFVLSIEPAVDPDPTPAATKVLAGDFSGSSANVTTGIVGDFSAAAGAFFLRTPTDETGTNNGNDQYGVWFGTPGAPPTPNFVLPTLPAGWAYEGWVVGDNGPISTGTFTTFNTMDSSNGFSGTQNNAGPPIPGEDFFLNAPTGETFPLDIRGRTVVISVEPVPDDSAAPFAMKPLVGTAGQDTAPNTHNFGQNLGSLPTGTVTR
ncbi:anti-sigma factor [Flavobacteriaceae bacterium S356]|uniref:Anti-sigma factor n=1 Tax=Asprobacillus argus TaxID=3076534 RepID=A0ABU3LET1_9FLAO|nr:anti-sigma factor [Flavobacteriaceae bacterium S356]